MITVKEASDIIGAHRPSNLAIKLPLLNSTGRILAKNIFTDTPFPPFDRVMMDGIAIKYDDFAKGIISFEIVGVQGAGQPPMTIAKEGTCVEIMTGAMMAIGVDCVVPYEHITIANGTATINTDVKPNQNVHPKGKDRPVGALILKEGCVIRSTEIGVLATLGYQEVEVIRQPRVAIISTGNELVDIHETPLPHQIRKSNVYTMASKLMEVGLKSDLFHISDDPEILNGRIADIIKDYQLVITSGGVSKGKFDFVPDAFKNAGITMHFHGVNQQPGKPFWFGTGKQCTVFAFPGNPVSSLVCFYRYLLPWFRLNNPFEAAEHMSTSEYAILAEDFVYDKPKTFFLQVSVVNENGKLIAYPMKGKGSGDLANLVDVTGFLELSEGKDLFKKGDAFPYYPF